MWWLLNRNNDKIEINLEKSFYCGDAAGRPKDFSDSDHKFALNIGIKFYDERYFTEKEEDVSKLVYARPYHPLDFENVYDNLINSDFVPCKKQEMIILVGPPASTKSSWAANIAKTHSKYVVVCQDELGTKPKVLALIKKSLKSGNSVIVDRKNEYIKDREEFITLAEDIVEDIQVRIFWFDVPRDLSEHLSTYREMITGKHIPSIVFNKFYSEKGKGLESPTDEEAPVTKVYFKKDMELVENATLFLSYLIGS